MPIVSSRPEVTIVFIAFVDGIPYRMKGRQARAIHPVRVAMGGELPKLSSWVFGQ